MNVSDMSYEEIVARLLKFKQKARTSDVIGACGTGMRTKTSVKYGRYWYDPEDPEAFHSEEEINLYETLYLKKIRMELDAGMRTKENSIIPI